MRRRFFVDQVRNGLAEISGEDARHLTKVLRVEVGQKYEISDNRNVYLAEIDMARKEHVVFRMLEKLAPEQPVVRTTLCAAIIKFDAFEWMIEKSTELGVSEIVPVIAVRSERGLEKAAVKRLGRWRRIALEAGQQSRRAFLPEIRQPVVLRDALRFMASHRYVLDELPGGSPLLDALPAQPASGDTIALLIGPEGGWTEDERAQFNAAGWGSITLGSTILRAETAAISALAIVNAAYLRSVGQ